MESPARALSYARRAFPLTLLASHRPALPETQNFPTVKITQVAGKRAPLRLADVEYRVEFNEAVQGWDVLRNGAPTAVLARKKRNSAIDSAIRDAKAERDTSAARIMVTCREGRMLQTLWKAP
jgi:hypothetical protein